MVGKDCEEVTDEVSAADAACLSTRIEDVRSDVTTRRLLNDLGENESELVFAPSLSPSSSPCLDDNSGTAQKSGDVCAAKCRKEALNVFGPRAGRRRNAREAG